MDASDLGPALVFPVLSDTVASCILGRGEAGVCGSVWHKCGHAASCRNDVRWRSVIFIGYRSGLGRWVCGGSARVACPPPFLTLNEWTIAVT
eukprot:scaffold303204_cov37-Tisochrysis_lutea.AAC.1